MQMVLIDGKKVSQEIKNECRQAAERMSAAHGIKPTLAVMIVGEDPASQIYVRNKIKDCEECGFISHTLRLDASASQEQVMEQIRALNADEKIDGVLVQMPLPRHIDAGAVISAIAPEKDVDCFCDVNTGKILRGAISDESFLPCTPAGVMELLRYYGINPAGKKCVVLGRSNIVGKPMALLLLAADATVTICHSKTKNLGEICADADILVCAVGKAKLVGADMVKEGAVVIDVGMNRDADGKLCGDADFDALKDKVSAITPVPGGVGPMTRALLMKNTLTSAQNRAKKL